MPKYAFRIIEENLDLIEFLNDGVRPLMEEKPTFFICEPNGRNEITTTIEFEDDLHQYDARDAEDKLIVLK